MKEEERMYWSWILAVNRRVDWGASGQAVFKG